jgi:hypothetical protein
MAIISLGKDTMFSFNFKYEQYIAYNSLRFLIRNFKIEHY